MDRDDHAPSLITVEHSDALFAAAVKPARTCRALLLPGANQERVRMLLCIMPVIEQARARHRLPGAARRRSGSLDLSADTLRRVFSRWRKEGRDWRPCWTWRSKTNRGTRRRSSSRAADRVDSHHRSVAPR